MVSLGEVEEFASPLEDKMSDRLTLAFLCFSVPISDLIRYFIISCLADGVITLETLYRMYRPNVCGAVFDWN